MNTFLIIFGFFLLISAGALFITTLQTRSRPAFTGGVVAVVVAILSILLGLTIVNVEPNERLVVFNRVTGNLAKPRVPGIAIINPITTSYRRYDVSFQNYTMSSTFDEGQIQGDDAVQTRTSGGQLVSIELTMIYRLDPEKVNLIHVNWPNESYQDDFVRSLLRSAVRDAVSLFSIESVIQERDSIDTQIETLVIPAMEEQGFFVEDILLRNIAFTDEYAASIEAAQMAEVRAREEEFRVEQFEQQAEQVQVRARGEAEARKITAEAEALALQLIADVLRENPQLLEYEYIQKLSDNVTVLALPANNPFIFDLQSFMNTLPEPSSDTNDSQSLIPTPEPENQNN